jgi:hypothetical protein
MVTAEERRERARLRSERYRRAHGILPRKPAQRPWLAEGISLWYRRRAKARQETALAFETSRQREVLSRAEAFVVTLQCELTEAQRCQAIAAGIIGEMQDGTPGAANFSASGLKRQDNDLNRVSKASDQQRCHS